MNIVYFDLESQKLFEEIGGRDATQLLLACGVTWSTARNDFAVYWEKDAAALIAELKAADRVVGFNIINFDYQVLKPYAPNENFRAFRSSDMLADIFKTLGIPLALVAVIVALWLWRGWRSLPVTAVAVRTLAFLALALALARPSAVPQAF